MVIVVVVVVAAAAAVVVAAVVVAVIAAAAAAVGFGCGVSTLQPRITFLLPSMYQVLISACVQ